MTSTEKSAVFRDGALRTAASRGETERVAELLEQGTGADGHNRFGTTALHLASRNGHLRIVELLLRHGAAAAHRDNHGNTAAVLATWGGHREVLQELLENAGDLPGQEKEICLVWAIILGDVATVELLLRAGADSGVRCLRGWTGKEFAQHWYEVGRNGPSEQSYREILVLLGLPVENPVKPAWRGSPIFPR
jgi:ankyrin repeat protein